MKKKQLILILSFVSIIVMVFVYSIFSDSKMMITLEGGQLSLNHNLNKDNYTVVWECDAGSLSSVDKNSIYTAPTKNTYYVYSGIDDKVIWSPKDSDGFSYSSATIKIYAFKHSGNNVYNKVDSKIYTDEITISSQSNNIIKADKRIFGNPIRKDSDDNWQQILIFDKQTNYIVLRYRHGKALNSSERIGWSTNAISLRKATFDSAPIYVPGNFNQDQFVFDNNTVCYDFLHFNNYYFDYSDTEAYPANIVITAFVTDKKGIRSSITEISIKYYYGEDGYYTVNPSFRTQNRAD